MQSGQTYMVKATDIANLRRMIREKHPEIEKTLLQTLSPEAKLIYEMILPSTRITQEVESEIIAAGARLLFPEHPAPIRETTRQLAHRSIATVYKVFFRIPSVTFVAQQIPTLWLMIFGQGKCEVTHLKKQSAIVLIKGLPNLIPEQHEEICGTIIGILEMTGAKQVSVTSAVDTLPDCWKWQLTWV